jgi:cyclopropane fatty-acyl-phospholipid synthase-like methyltransferase
MEKSTFEFYDKLAKNNPNKKSVKLLPSNDFTLYDANFILKHSNLNSEILDLASGTGLTLEKIVDQVKSIIAVELFKEFSDLILKHNKIQVINSDIKDFEINQKFDIITFFGIMQYYSENEAQDIYIKYKKLLKNKGKIIIKNQFGVREDVVVNGYSENLKCDYFSEYRWLEKEKELLRSIGFENVDHFDIYPAECNKWDNTHFYSIVASI